MSTEDTKLDVEYATLADESNGKGLEEIGNAEFEEFWRNQTSSAWSTSGSHWTSESQAGTLEGEEEEETESTGEYGSDEGSFWASRGNGEADVDEETRRIYIIDEYLVSSRNFSKLTMTNILLHQKLMAMQNKIDRLAPPEFQQAKRISAEGCGGGHSRSSGRSGSTSSDSYNIMGTNYSPQQAYRWRVIQYYSLLNSLTEFTEDTKLVESKLKKSLDHSIEDYEYALKTLLELAGYFPERNAAYPTGSESAKEIIMILLRLKDRIANFYYYSIKSYFEMSKYSPYSSLGSLNLSGKSFKSIEGSLRSLSESLKIIGPIREFENNVMLYKNRIQAQRATISKARNAIVNIIQATAHTREKIALVDKMRNEQKIQLRRISEKMDIVKAKHEAAFYLYRRVTSSDTYGDLKRSLKMQQEIGQLKFQTKKFYLQKSYMERLFRENEYFREQS